MNERKKMGETDTNKKMGKLKSQPGLDRLIEIIASLLQPLVFGNPDEIHCPWGDMWRGSHIFAGSHLQKK